MKLSPKFEGRDPREIQDSNSETGTQGLASQFGFRNSQRGIALIIVMISIFVLTVLAAGFAYSMKVETKLAQHANNETELQWLGRSGVEYCRWVLALQGSCPAEPYDAMSQPWAGGSGGPCATNGPLAELQKEVHLGHGYFNWKMTDNERKWNINVMAMPGNERILQQALILIGADASQMTPVVNSILDWIHPLSGSRLEGTSSDYYQGLNPPYEAKSGPMDDLTELMLVKGITPELYWGMTSSNHPPAAFQARLGQLSPLGQAPGTSTVGLVDLFTPISSGRININTASAEVLQLIPGVDPMAAEAIVGARGGEDDGTGLVGPYRSLDQVRRVPNLPLELVRQLSQYCDVRSRTFEAEVTASVGGSTRTFYAILVRNSPRDVQVLNFYWKM